MVYETEMQKKVKAQNEAKRLAQELDNTRKELESERAAHEATKRELVGTSMYVTLAKRVFDRILEADAKCDPPLDIDLRCAAIIWERDNAVKQLAAMREALQKLDTITCDCGHLFAEHSFSADSVGCDIPHCKCGRSIVEVIEKRFKSIFAASPAPQAQAVKCDGNHAMPICADPQCWQRD